MKFKKGDRVSVIAPYGQANIGTKGTVAGYHPNGKSVAVKIDNSDERDWTHNCDGMTPDDDGYYIEENCLSVIEVKALKKIDYKPGTPISDYVKKLLKSETAKTRIKWLRTFDNCVLPEEVRETIDEAITLVLRAEMFEEWGINDHFEKGLTNSILLYGPPGTGKTMIAESIAAVLGKNLMKLGNGDIQSNIPGQTERNIKESFKKALDSDCVLLIDECDSLLYNRDAVGSILGSEINALLTEIENFDGVVLMTTNRLHKLDSALQRRIVAKVELPLPEEKARKQIWQKLIPKKMPVGELDFKELAEANFSGGEIKNAVVLAARKAIAKNKKMVEMADFRKAIISIAESKEDYDKVKENYVEVR